ncbi:unnamed protein product, partial [Discosporangium mesarthrocarpum]
MCTLRDMMAGEVKVSSVAMLVLLTKGRPIGKEKDDMTLGELGFKNRQQLVVSQVLGEWIENDSGVEEKNRQFVGDLLFGGSTATDAASPAPKLSKAITTMAVPINQLASGAGGEGSPCQSGDKGGG